MERPPKKRRLLFLNADNRNPPTQRRTRSKSLDSKVRRHLMVDIGMSRRKPSKAPQFNTFVWSLSNPSEALESNCQGDDSANRDFNHLQVPVKDSAVSETSAQYTALYPSTPPILHALSVFEKEWGEDSFSAYGFTLIMVTGRNAMGSTCSKNTFWFPFAFRKSAFLHHYKQIFTSPDVLIPLYRESTKELQSLALGRSLETIQCVEARISSSDASSATSDSVLYAVLSLVCYNVSFNWGALYSRSKEAMKLKFWDQFTSMDFGQAMTHVKGMWMVITARGGISTLEANQDLMIMISWVDITAALLHDTKPLFPLSALMASPSVFHSSGLETLPAPLLSVINDENTQNMRFIKVMSCVGDLNALAGLVRFELATKGNAIWDDEEQIGFLMNPITHQLLNQPLISEPVSGSDIISEVLRLGAMIWIITVKRRCRSYPGTAQSRISTLLKMLPRKSNVVHVWNSPDLRLVRLWLLVLCSISEPTDEDLVTSIEMIASDIQEPRSVSWPQIMADIRQMPWVDIFEPQCAKLGQQLLSQCSEGDKWT